MTMAFVLKAFLSLGIGIGFVYKTLSENLFSDLSPWGYSFLWQVVRSCSSWLKRSVSRLRTHSCLCCGYRLCPAVYLGPFVCRCSKTVFRHIACGSLRTGAICDVTLWSSLSALSSLSATSVASALGRSVFGGRRPSVTAKGGRLSSSSATLSSLSEKGDENKVRYCRQENYNKDNSKSTHSSRFIKSRDAFDIKQLFSVHNAL